ncbi:MAG: hypothetical protein NTW87_19585 [Planctomycetota bacterium]|nr:hypothetical protein [Planctomycetota bacterium]
MRAERSSGYRMPDVGCSAWSRLALALLLASAAAVGTASVRAGDEQDTLRVGVQADGRIVVPTNQILTPAGKQITFPGRPVDLVLTNDEKTLIVKNMKGLVFIDVDTATITQNLSSSTGFSVTGLVLIGDKVYSSDVANHVRVAERGGDGKYAWAKPIQLAKPKAGKDAHPAGMAWDGKDHLFVTSTRGNNVQRVNLQTGAVDEVIETTTIANDGTVSVVEPVDGKWKQTQTIRVGLHPSGMTFDKRAKLLFVANANSDTVSVLDTESGEVLEQTRYVLEARLPFGSGCNAVALSPSGDTLYVANGTNNCVVVSHRVVDVELAAAAPRPRFPGMARGGLIPTGWYPGAVCASSDGKKLYVANIKGHGSLSQPRPVEKGKQSKDHLGSVSSIDVPDAQQLKRYTEQVNANNRLAYSLAGLEKPRADAKAAVVPERHGEPSLLKHVIYIIKENRTYDQVLGDMKEGDGDPNLTMFGEEVTPNHHALARQFTLFDNFYCSGVLSADGHNWTCAAYATDYLERSFGGFTRSYPDNGEDPLAYARSGFLWNNALARGKTIRNYGEFIWDEPFAPPGTTWTDLYNDYKNNTSNVKVKVRVTVKALEPYTREGYPWFPLIMPDVYRARLFMSDLKDYEEKGEFPNLTLLTLPCDHTVGTRPGFPTPRAAVADNDLALGQIVEAVTKSRFWPETCIFVVEDDPQSGFDHVDAHRTVALVISPYTKRKYVDHTNYNQTGMVKTIELLLGLPAMNQMDLSATPLRNCFHDAPDLTPYACVANKIALDELSPSPSKLKGKALGWARKSLELNLDEGDAADEDTLNRILWHATMGDEKPYPEQFAGGESE